MNLENAEILVKISHADISRKELLHEFKACANLQTEEEKIVSMLSNTMKHGVLTIDHIKKESFSDEIIKAIMVLNLYKELDYPSYLLKVKENSFARAVEIENTKYTISITPKTEKTKIKELNKIIRKLSK